MLRHFKSFVYNSIWYMCLSTLFNRYHPCRSSEMDIAHASNNALFVPSLLIAAIAIRLPLCQWQRPWLIKHSTDRPDDKKYTLFGCFIHITQYTTHIGNSYCIGGRCWRSGVERNHCDLLFNKYFLMSSNQTFQRLEHDTLTL